MIEIFLFTFQMQIKAFSVIELLLTIVLLSIVLGFGISTLVIIGKQTEIHKKALQLSVENQQLILFLNRDIDLAEEILVENDSTLILHESNNSITYFFRNKNVVRVNKSGAINFETQVRNFGGQPATFGSKTFTTGISMTISCGKKFIPIKLNKLYTSEDLLGLSN